MQHAARDHGVVLALLIIFVIGVTFFVSINSLLEITQIPIGISKGWIFGKLKIILGWIKNTFLQMQTFETHWENRKNCKHIPFNIEGCDIADDVVVGPINTRFRYWKGKQDEEHATVNISVVGKLSDRSLCNCKLCLLYPESCFMVEVCKDVFWSSILGAIGVQILISLLEKNVLWNIKVSGLTLVRCFGWCCGSSCRYRECCSY